MQRQKAYAVLDPTPKILFDTVSGELVIPRDTVNPLPLAAAQLPSVRLPLSWTPDTKQTLAALLGKPRPGKDRVVPAPNLDTAAAEVISPSIFTAFAALDIVPPSPMSTKPSAVVEKKQDDRLEVMNLSERRLGPSEFLILMRR